MADSKDLTPLLDPRSIAIVGASPKESGWPARIRTNLERFGYTGKLFAVNPRYDSLWGRPCFGSLNDLPEVVDNAVIIVPAPLVVELLQGVEQPKFRSAIVMSGGFGEGADEAGLERKAFLQEFARAKQIPLCGPNCMGLVSLETQAILFPDLRLDNIRRGGLGIVSQSGGVVGALTRAVFSRGLGLKYYVSSGNEIVSDLADYLRHFVKDPDVRVLLAVVEGVKDSDRLRRVAKEALEAEKPILLLKVGRTEKGREAALAHTGSLAGNDRIFDAFCAGNGLIRAIDLDEILNTAELFLAKRCLPPGKRAAFVTFSGGLRALVADLAGDAGLALPDLEEKSERILSDLLGVGAAVGNPLDSGWGALSSQDTYLKCIHTLLEDSRVDMLALQEELPLSDARPDKQSNLLAVAEIARSSQKPLAAFSMITQGANDFGRAFKAKCGLPFLEETRNAVLAMKHLGTFAESVRKHRERVSAKPGSSSLGGVERGLLKANKVLNEWDSYQLLAKYGIPLPRMQLTSVEGVVPAAEAMGYPVVLKQVLHGVTHKTELGAVRVDLRGRSDLEAACSSMEEGLRGLQPAQRGGFLVQEMVRGGVEVIVGSSDDPQFGPAVMFGLGGELVELYEDVVFRIAPVDEESAMEMIRGIRGFPLLQGFRGRTPVDLHTLAKTIVAVSELAVDGRELIESIDINPFICLPEGGRAVDAVVVSRAEERGVRG